jgi:hypothetical protein
MLAGAPARATIAMVAAVALLLALSAGIVWPDPGRSGPGAWGPAHWVGLAAYALLAVPSARAFAAAMHRIRPARVQPDGDE